MLTPYSLPENDYSALYRDFLSSMPQSIRFLGRHYSDTDAFKEKAEEVCAAFTGDRQRLFALLSTYNRELDCSAQTMAQIEKLKDFQAVTVLTGQQAGLLGGPLFTVYKAISAVKHARNLEKILARPVVPIFWIASEDHDFSEANHCWMLGRENELQRIELELKHTGQPVGMLSLTDVVGSDIIKRIAAFSMKTDFSGDVRALLEKAFLSSQTPADWFARIMVKLFADEGLVMFNPLLTEARKILSPFYVKVVEKMDAAQEALDLRENALQSAGYPLQVERDRDASLLMHVKENRAALFYKDGYYTTRDGMVGYSRNELLELAENSPQSLSPNVLLRPLAQDSLFPTVTYIPGPGELAYFAQATALYPVLGQIAPILCPRPGLTIVEPRVAKHIKRYEIDEKCLLSKLDQFLKRELRKIINVDLDEIFGRLRCNLAVEYQGLKKDLRSIDGQLAELAEKNLQHLFGEIKYLENQAQREAKNKNSVIVRHFADMQRSLRPQGKLQERIINIFAFQIKYGPDFWRKLLDEFPVAPGHYLFYYQPGKGNGDGA